MTPQQAIEILDRYLQNYMGTRADHALIQQALGALQEMIAQAQQPPAQTGAKQV